MANHEEPPAPLSNRHRPKPIAKVVFREMRVWSDHMRHIPNTRERERLAPHPWIGEARVVLSCPPFVLALVDDSPRVSRGTRQRLRHVLKRHWHQMARGDSPVALSHTAHEMLEILECVLPGLGRSICLPTQARGEGLD
eukprot:4892557-Prymnesium_polylepis.2